jgi:cytidine deaminase
MKVKSTDQPKTLFNVTIENSSYKTWATSEEKAIANACFRFAEDEDEEVALVRWKVKNEQLTVTVTEE